MGSYDWVLLVIFAVIFALIRFFRSRREEEDPASREEAQERAREIQKEIRRRIAERRRRDGGEAPPVRELPPVPTVWAARPVGEENEAPQAPQDVPGRQMESAPAIRREPSAGLPYQLDQELERLRQAQAAAQKPVAVRARRRPARRASYAEVLSPSTWQLLRQGMKRPRGLREAFIYAEVLGVPLALRRRGGFMQFWEE
jgi:type IV secretory pathway VirB10-like protein